MNRTIIIIPALWLLSLSSFAANVDTISIYSNAMHKEFKCVVILPDNYYSSLDIYKNKSYPVVYLLHGYDGWYSNWIIREPKLKDYVDQYQLIIVCPDGGKSSWYFDSPVDSTMKYETYIGKEVPGYMDTHYKTIKDRKARAITGLSMGGHGALFIAFRHAERFGGCGSMSGGVDLNYSRNKYDIIKRIGDTIKHADNWRNYMVINIIENYPGNLSAGADSLAIIVDCGIEDFYYEANKNLHEKMLKLSIPHDYSSRPGKHEWAYWRNSIQYHLLFFKNYFEKNK